MFNRLIFLLSLILAQSLYATPRTPILPTPSPDQKGCIQMIINGQVVFKCMAGGGGTKCSGDFDCYPTRCTEELRCSQAGRGGLCDSPSECTRQKSCFLTGNGMQCLPGWNPGFGDDCTQDPSECERATHCEIINGHPGCVPGGHGATCTWDSECAETSCELDWATGKRVCVLGSRGVGGPCYSNSDCDVTDERRCNLAGQCIYQAGGGALCSGVDGCSKLFCVKDKNGAPKCVKGSENGSNIPCNSGAVVGTECTLPPTSCGKDAKGQKKCLPGGGGASCTSDSQCLEMRCEGGPEYPPDGIRCVLGGSGKRCGADSDCRKPTCQLLANSGWKCARDTSGAGGPSCAGSNGSLNDDGCIHTECSQGTCVRKEEPGVSTCSLEGNGSDGNPDCMKKDCVGDSEEGFECKPVEGSTVDHCQTGGDCLSQGKIGGGEPRFNLSRSGNLEELKGSEQAKKTREVLQSAKLDYLGGPAAPISIVMFHDFSCGMSRALYREVMQKLTAEYIERGTVKIAFVDFPLIPRESDYPPYFAARCAISEDQQREFMDAFYEGKTIPDVQKVVEAHAKNLNRLKSCMKSSAARASLNENIALGRQLEVKGTPEVFVNGIQFGGYRSYEEWRKLLNSLDQK